MAQYYWNGKPTDNYTMSSAYQQFAPQTGLIQLMGPGTSAGTEIPYGIPKAAGTGGGWKGALGGWFNRAKGAGANAWNYVRNPNNFNYSFTGANGASPGLTAFGHNLGKFATIGTGVTQGIQAVKGLSDYGKAKTTAEDLMSDIVASASANPLVDKYLTADQRKLLNEIRRGNYSTYTPGDALSGAMSDGLSNALSGAAMGLAGGLPGVIVGGVGGLVNGGISGATNGVNRRIDRLQSLYDTLAEAEQSYQAMKRPVFTGLGIQHQYQNMYA